ncbi:hypothetical protein BV898_03783 [Hypsibius exemplaris]|uniref:RRM domain-containing protein n=1 Tax=Hypsibius exemplaris TaxID=2072580 RepID=A0A1W0X4C2_HYPEX|nr:hypothetical protein BV898_03783 [Hypsibius exemplaris]
MSGQPTRYHNDQLYVYASPADTAHLQESLWLLAWNGNPFPLSEEEEQHVQEILEQHSASGFPALNSQEVAFLQKHLANNYVMKSTCRDKLFVNYLPSDFTWQDLRRLFRKFGPIADVQVPLKSNGANSGYGFVTYGGLSAAECAASAKMALDRSFCGPKQLLVKLCRDGWNGPPIQDAKIIIRNPLAFMHPGAVQPSHAHQAHLFGVIDAVVGPTLPIIQRTMVVPNGKTYEKNQGRPYIFVTFHLHNQANEAQQRLQQRYPACEVGWSPSPTTWQRKGMKKRRRPMPQNERNPA